MVGLRFSEFAASCPDDASLGDDIIYGDVVRVGVNFVDELKIICDTDFYGACVVEQTVIVAFATSDSVALPIIGDGRNNDQVDLRHICGVVTVGFFDVEGSEVETRLRVWQNLKIETVDSRKIETLA